MVVVAAEVLAVAVLKEVAESRPCVAAAREEVSEEAAVVKEAAVVVAAEVAVVAVRSANVTTVRKRTLIMALPISSTSARK